jgi:AcrR family transcriptional regulator
VSDIVRKAKVGRATFYAHYGSKHQLLHSQMSRMVVPMLRERPGEPWLFDCTALFDHLGRSRAIYRSLLAGPSRLSSGRIVQDVIEKRAATLLSCSGVGETQAAPLNIGISARFAAATLLTILVWWIENNAESPPQQMQSIYQSLVGPGLRALLIP